MILNYVSRLGGSCFWCSNVFDSFNPVLICFFFICILFINNHITICIIKFFLFIDFFLWILVMKVFSKGFALEWKPTVSHISLLKVFSNILFHMNYIFWLFPKSIKLELTYSSTKRTLFDTKLYNQHSHTVPVHVG